MRLDALTSAGTMSDADDDAVARRHLFQRICGPEL
jgi:hypothetical protein